MGGNSLLSRILERDADGAESKIYSPGDIGTRRSGRREKEAGPQQRGFTVERAVEIIDDLPSDVPRKSVVFIVRRTLEGAGIEVEDFDRYTRAQIPKLTSKRELAQNRQKDIRERTEELIRSLKEDIRKAREACEAILAEEEREISRASKELENLQRLRAFFGFPEVEADEATRLNGEDTQLSEPLDASRAQVGQRFDSAGGAHRLTHGST